jgi:hypothetical protein
METQSDLDIKSNADKTERYRSTNPFPLISSKPIPPFRSRKKKRKTTVPKLWCVWCVWCVCGLFCVVVWVVFQVCAATWRRATALAPDLSVLSRHTHVTESKRTCVYVCVTDL